MTDLYGIRRFLSLCITNPKEAYDHIAKASRYATYYRELRGTIFYQTYYDLYNALKPETTLLDLGGYIGNSAAYFAMNPNVKTVISYEPHPKTYEQFQSLIALSPQRDKIVCFNQAVTPALNYVRNARSVSVGENRVVPSHRGKRTVTLTEILRTLKPPIAIKCDIEGDETNLFKTDLRKVYAIEVEYHDGKGTGIAADLTARGFKIRYVMEQSALIFAVKA